MLSVVNNTDVVRGRPYGGCASPSRSDLSLRVETVHCDVGVFALFGCVTAPGVYCWLMFTYCTRLMKLVVTNLLITVVCY